MGQRTNKLTLFIALLAICCASAAKADAAEDLCPSALTGLIPARSQFAATGIEFARATAALSERKREKLIAAELLAGNVPGFLRRLKPVKLPGWMAMRGFADVTICVTPDYLALGSDDDFLRIPMGLRTASTAAKQFGFVLPTPRMVDAIYEHADVHLRPVPMPPGPKMRSNAYYWHHQSYIQQQRFAQHVSLGHLIAGHKKDLVMTNRLHEKAGRVAIYGWHRGVGDPIQPLSTVHGSRYADYSHGVRLVSSVAYVDGEPRSLVEILEDPWLAAIVSDEGPIIDMAPLMARTSDQFVQATRLE
ncbi:MAG: hypothetical protein ACR2QJ_17630 [Geminicoccaceae bacterium]